MEDSLRLSDIATGEQCVVVKVNGHGRFRGRILEMGFVKGEKVTVVKNAPLRDPIEYRVMDSHVSLRRSEARQIEVVPLSCPLDSDQTSYYGTLTEDTFEEIIRQKTKTINLALVGNPNSGKTSFFNRATGLHEKVGNYGGVTVDAKKGTVLYKGYTINLVDLPGTYSITEYTPEEVYVRKYLTEDHPDVVLNVVDSSNLERNLYLTTQLIDMNIRVVMALNMYDELQKEGASLDYAHLGQMIGIPIVPTTASRGEGIDRVFDTVIDVFEDREKLSRHIHINYGQEIEHAIRRISRVIRADEDLSARYSTRYLSLRLLCRDKWAERLFSQEGNDNSVHQTADKYIERLEKEFKEDTSSIITNAKFGFIRGALKETFAAGEKDKRQLSNAIDTILTNQWLGIPLLVLFIWITFQATFTLGDYPMQWIEEGVSWLSGWVSGHISEGMFSDMLVDGIIAGVGGVIVFLPNILILFFFISLMEDSGYMARAAFIMDKLMHRIGLHGKSFIPLLIGFGCNVPAIMATRTLEGRKDRILTMLIIPFMSCSARLPVYVLLVSAFFSENQGLVLMSIYLVGVLVAVLTAMLLKKVFFVKESDPFVMELPPYRMPTLRNTAAHMWEKSVQYLKKMGTVILSASILIWALGYFPRQDSVYGETSGVVEVVADVSAPEASSQLEGSYIGRLGHAIEPAIRPLGFDWKMGVSLISGLAAKEIVVSTMGILYHADIDEGGSDASLISNIRRQRHDSGPLAGERVFTPLVAYGFMLFILIYFPCMAAVAAIRKEAGWRWALFTVFYTTGLAWLVSFVFYQVGSRF